jgi:hypothetical protein
MAGIEAAELRAQRMITHSFILADANLITLYRSSTTSDGAGGTVHNPPTPLPPQTMRLIPLSDGADERLTADGKMVRPTYMLQGDYNADLQRGDTFTTEQGRYEVVFVNENRQYQVKGEVVYRGQ